VLAEQSRQEILPSTRETSQCTIDNDPGRYFDATYLNHGNAKNESVVFIETHKLRDKNRWTAIIAILIGMAVLS